MKQVTIYEFNDSFDIHNEAGHLIKGGFATHGEAALWAKKNNFQIQDIFFGSLKK